MLACFVRTGLDDGRSRKLIGRGVPILEVFRARFLSSDVPRPSFVTDGFRLRRSCRWTGAGRCSPATEGLVIRGSSELKTAEGMVYSGIGILFGADCSPPITDCRGEMSTDAADGI